MIRSAARCVLATIVVTIAVPAVAEERTGRLVAPSQAVANAWAREAREAEQAAALRPTSRAAKSLFGTYAVLQGLDMYTTIVARRNGAREVNPEDGHDVEHHSRSPSSGEEEQEGSHHYDDRDERRVSRRGNDELPQHSSLAIDGTV